MVDVGRLASTTTSNTAFWSGFGRWTTGMGGRPGMPGGAGDAVPEPVAGSNVNATSTLNTNSTSPR